MPNDRPTLNLYTDGACRGNQHDTNNGGWGAVLEWGDTQKELHGGERNTTNNRMEITGVLEGLKALSRDGLKVRVFSDSSYVVNCFQQRWYVGWRKRGWVNTSKKPVANRELWEELLALVEANDIEFIHIKGHVDLDSPTTNVQKWYTSFLKKAEGLYSCDKDMFLHITRMNNKADALANLGIDEL